jgi:hypothetical protein
MLFAAKKMYFRMDLFLPIFHAVLEPEESPEFPWYDQPHYHGCVWPVSLQHTIRA